MKLLFTSILLSILLFCACDCEAQNWQCLQQGVKHYFINTNGYLRGIRIDSTIVQGDSTLYYPFHTVRASWEYWLGALYWNLDSSRGCWLGSKVAGLADGTFVFDNLRGDTVFVKTLANIGDTWTFFKDSGSIYYTATITTADTMSVLGVSDSMKKIVITAMSDSGVVSSDPLNGFYIVLSKHFGFVTVFDLYTFPYHRAGYAYSAGEDFYTDLSMSPSYLFDYSSPGLANSIFTITSFVNPVSEQVFTSSVGAVYETEFYSTLIETEESYRIDTITGKTVLPHSTIYSYSEGREDIVAGTPSFSHYSGNIVCNDSSFLFDTTAMPEEYYSYICNYYYPDDSSYCVKSPLYTKGIIFHDDGTEQTEKYKYGLGTIDSLFLGDMFQSERRLLFYSKDGVDCGHFYPLAINNVGIVTQPLKIYPNPATSTLSITAMPEIGWVTITDLLGQVMYRQYSSSEQMQVNIAGWTSGVYVVKTGDGEVRRFVKE